ncbi:MliC family protein [Marivita sp. S2033]|uniref:MliC family protein n=1 Tax=Marivita sp. S2033 TaxID=3373187 RepID=UPI003981C3A0
MRLAVLSAIGLGWVATTASSADVQLVFDLEQDGTVISAAYECDDATERTVRYLSAGNAQLALVPLDGVETVFVNVVSGSGAQYVSGQYEWWIKGDTATLHNRIQDAGDVVCKTEDDPAN